MTRMFVPGPVDVAADVLQVSAKPMLPHRSKDFEEIFQRAAKKAETLFYTQYRVFLGTHSGSGMQEAGIRNFVNQDVLCLVNGAFSKRWFDVAVSNGKADRLDAEWGKPNGRQLREALKAKHYSGDHLHNETSTGVENPLRPCQVVQEASGYADFGGRGFLFGRQVGWTPGESTLLTSSQKCLALPPGLFAGGRE